MHNLPHRSLSHSMRFQNGIAVLKTWQKISLLTPSMHPTTATPCGQCGNLETAIINSGEIAAQAFRGCESLKSLTLGNGVTTVGHGAFEDCSMLASVDMSDNVTELGQSAFAYCTSLKKIILGDGLKIIGKDAFRDCTALSDVTLGKNVTSILGMAFYQCNIKSITIPSGVTLISIQAFGRNPLESMKYEYLSGWFTASRDYSTSGTSVNFTTDTAKNAELYLSSVGSYLKRNP